MHCKRRPGENTEIMKTVLKRQYYNSLTTEIEEILPAYGVLRTHISTYLMILDLFCSQLLVDMSQMYPV